MEKIETNDSNNKPTFWEKVKEFLKSIIDAFIDKDGRYNNRKNSKID